MVNVGIIGCGLVGTKRATQLAGAKLVALCDLMDFNNTQNLKKKLNDGSIYVYKDFRDLLKYGNVDAVIVATIHRDLAPVAIKAIEAGKHVLIEKPAGICLQDIEDLLYTEEHNSVAVRVGFNHRYHPAIKLAKAFAENNSIGEVFSIRARYGHGGRLGYDKEWRFDPFLAGGGELLEQGIHLIDLARYFLGDFTGGAVGWADRYFWKPYVESVFDHKFDDNAHILLRSEKNRIANLSVSCTEWKNLFCFEITGTKGKLIIDGLGGSYGTEKLTVHLVRPEMGFPFTNSVEYPDVDNSWNVEFAEFLEDIERKRRPSANLDDALKAWEIISNVYDMTKECKENEQ